MSDEKLRELERAFQENGSEEAELAWLRERARAGEKLDWESYSRLSELDVEAAAGYLRWRVEIGDLTEAHMRVAAHCGDRAAGGTSIPMIDEGWWVELASHSTRFGLAIAQLLSEHALEAWEKGAPVSEVGLYSCLTGQMAEGTEVGGLPRKVVEGLRRKSETQDDSWISNELQRYDFTGAFMTLGESPEAQERRAAAYWAIRDLAAGNNCWAEAARDYLTTDQARMNFLEGLRRAVLRVVSS